MDKMGKSKMSRRTVLKKMGIATLGLPLSFSAYSSVGRLHLLKQIEDYKNRINKFGRIYHFKLRDVELLSSDFKKAEQLGIKYMFQLDMDRLLSPFLRESGLPQKKDPYGNWEGDGLDGHIAGHYLSALSCAYASTQDPEIKKRLDYMLEVLNTCQKTNGNGYIGGVPEGSKIWEEIKGGTIKADNFSLNDRWVPLYNIHKTFSGLRDAYFIAEHELAKEMLVGMTDWIDNLIHHLDESQIQEMLISEHGGLNEVFADVAFITGKKKYLDLAKKFNHQAILDPLVKGRDELTGKHVNTQVPKVIGFKRISELSHNQELEDAAANFWDFVVTERAVTIGGVGAAEHFGPADDFSKAIHSIEGPETCVTYNLLKLAKMLYTSDPQLRYIEYYERALYNHILSTQHPKTGGLVYFTQLRPNHYRVYSQPETSMWCCVGSGIENHVRYGEFIYSYKDNDLYVNLFIPSKLNWEERSVEVVQINNFPGESKTMLEVFPRDDSTEFTLHIRIPSWSEETPKVTVNGTLTDGDGAKANWISLNREWHKGDRVVVEFKMGLYIEQLPDHSNFYSFLYGPVVLGTRMNREDLKGLFADESRMGHVAQGRQIPMAESPILVGAPSNVLDKVKRAKGNELHFNLKDIRKGTQTVDLELEPFYKIHENRYMLYWPQALEGMVEDLQERLRRQEEGLLELDAKTIDKVVCGEQQPESDHHIQKKGSKMGEEGNVHWRDTTDWFSYKFRNDDRKASKLYIEYFTDPNRSTLILVNGKTIGEIKDNPEESAGFTTFKIFNLSKKQAQEKEFRIELRKNTFSDFSHKILEVRLL